MFQIATNRAGRGFPNVCFIYLLFAVLGCIGVTSAIAQPEGDDAADAGTMEAVAVTTEQPAAPAAETFYHVTALDIQYQRENAQHTPVDQLLDLTIQLVETDDGLVGSGEGAEGVSKQYRLGDLTAGGGVTLGASAVLAISEAIKGELNRQGIIGVLVTPDPTQIDLSSGADRRGEGDTSLTIQIYTAVVTRVQTVASGGRVPLDERINNPKHARILRLSPVQPSGEGEGGNDLLRRDRVDRYVLWLNRHPGRRVDVAVAPGVGPGEASLDYLVSETRPWSVYAQASNTGTKQTNEWRERLGFVDNQLTNHDDILTLDYITAGFDEAHAIVGSYDFPISFERRIRGRVFANYSEFTASDVGLANERFTGDGWTVGGEVSMNVYQRRELFVDAFAGARWFNTSVTNEVVQITGEESFFAPQVGVRLDRTTDESSIRGSLAYEFSLSDLSGAHQDEMTKLGRLNPDEDWQVLQGDAEVSFFLEPLFRGADSQKTTLAHEVVLHARGQYAFDKRLIPNVEQVVGGMYTVRGYPESVTAGDTVVIGGIEYRYHVPRAFGVREQPGELFGRTFRYAPQQPYGRPDWDLILRGFVDAGRTINSKRQDFENDETLLGAGVGVELLLYRNVNLRMDWATALEDTTAQNVDSGSSQFHFVFTLLY